MKASALKEMIKLIPTTRVVVQTGPNILPLAYNQGAELESVTLSIQWSYGSVKSRTGKCVWMVKNIRKDLGS